MIKFKGHIVLDIVVVFNIHRWAEWENSNPMELCEVRGYASWWLLAWAAVQHPINPNLIQRWRVTSSFIGIDSFIQQITFE